MTHIEDIDDISLLLHSGLHKPRNALANLEDRSAQVDRLHAKLVTSMRAAVRAPFAAAPAHAKDLLRSLVSHSVAAS